MSKGRHGMGAEAFYLWITIFDTQKSTIVHNASVLHTDSERQGILIRMSVETLSQVNSRLGDAASKCAWRVNRDATLQYCGSPVL